MPPNKLAASLISSAASASTATSHTTPLEGGKEDVRIAIAADIAGSLKKTTAVELLAVLNAMGHSLRQSNYGVAEHLLWQLIPLFQGVPDDDEEI